MVMHIMIVLSGFTTSLLVGGGNYFTPIFLYSILPDIIHIRINDIVMNKKNGKILFVIIIGIFSVGLYIIISADEPISPGIKNNSTENPVDWLVCTAKDKTFSINYPSSWIVATPGYEEVIPGERNLGIHSSDPMGGDFAVGIVWHEYEGISDCQSWIDKTHQDFADEYPDMAESAKERSYPISLLTINGQEVCRKPDVYAHDSHDEQYVIVNNDLVFNIYFPNKEGGLEVTDPVGKNVIAHEMLESLIFY
jgi:hypothetical protein